MYIDWALIVAGILIAIVLIFILKDIVKIIINSILGLLILFFVNYFDLLGYVGRPDIPYTPINILLCALGGEIVFQSRPERRIEISSHKPKIPAIRKPKRPSMEKPKR